VVLVHPLDEQLDRARRADARGQGGDNHLLGVDPGAVVEEQIRQLPDFHVVEELQLRDRLGGGGADQLGDCLVVRREGRVRTRRLDSRRRWSRGRGGTAVGVGVAGATVGGTGGGADVVTGPAPQPARSSAGSAIRLVVLLLRTESTGPSGARVPHATTDPRRPRERPVLAFTRRRASGRGKPGGVATCSDKRPSIAG
jgi:hypothetical protein